MAAGVALTAAGVASRVYQQHQQDYLNQRINEESSIEEIYNAYNTAQEQFNNYQNMYQYTNTPNEGLKEFRAPIEYGKSELLYEESEIAVMFVGHMSFLAEQVREDLKAAGYQCSLINARFVKPLDTEMIRKISENHRILVTIEENVLTGGFGEQVEDFVMREGIPLKVCTIGISDDYVEHGNVDVLRKEVGLDRESIVKKVIADDRRIKEEK